MALANAEKPIDNIGKYFEGMQGYGLPPMIWYPLRHQNNQFRE